MQSVKIPGTEILLSGEKYIMPSLPIKAFTKGDASQKLQKLGKDMADMKEKGLGAITSESWSNLISLVTTALNRNYPNVTDEQVEDGLDDIMVLMGLMENLVSQSKEYKENVAKERKNAVERLMEKQAN